MWVVAGLTLAGLTGLAAAQAPRLDDGLRARIDHFVEGERRASGIPGIALAIVHAGRTAHLRGFGDDGHGRPISGQTPFPIGSLTKSFTALLVRQAIDAGQLDADAPVQRILPWFGVADTDASARITLRHLLDQTSGLSRADGMALLLQPDAPDLEALARSLRGLALRAPPGAGFEYSNLNYVVLGAVLQAVTGRSWAELVRTRILQPLAMAHSHTDLEAARHAGMTALHRMWFGLPVQQRASLPAGLAPTGGLASSAADMARYLQMVLAHGMGASGRVLSIAGVSQWLQAASPPARATLLGADFAFAYAEGWFVGPFGAAADARWHLGNLPAFAAWMVLLPDTQQAVVVLLNANSELPFNNANAVMSRVPIGVVNLLRGQAPPQGPSLRLAYLPFNVTATLLLPALAALAWRAARAHRPTWPAAGLLLLAASVAGAMQLWGPGLAALFAFAPDLALVLATALALLCLPAVWRAGLWLRAVLPGRSAAHSG